MHTLTERPALILQCPNCAHDCEALFEYDDRPAETYICQTCAYLSRLHDGRRCLAPLTDVELYSLTRLKDWHRIAEEQGVIRMRSTAIPKKTFRPAVLYPDPDPPGVRTFWSGVGFYAAGALSLAAVTVVSVMAWRAL